jgi:hypothetical protein
MILVAHLLRDLRAEVTVGAGVAVEMDAKERSAVVLAAPLLPREASSRRRCSRDGRFAAVAAT